MAQFSKLVITQAGQKLISGVLSGDAGSLRFTRISISAAEYDLSELEELTELPDVRQSSLISRAERSGESDIAVEAAITNEQLAEGYYMRAIGLFAEDPNSADGGEILFAVTVEQSGNCYMPPFNGITVSGAAVKLIVAVGNAERISLETNSAAVATVLDIKRMEQTLAEHNSDENSHADIRALALNSVQKGEVYTKAQSDAAIKAHNADASAHGAIIGNISQLEGEVARLEGEVSEIKLRIDTNITANAFSVTFGTLDGLSVSGVHNAARGTVDF